MTEECLDEATLAYWTEHGSIYRFLVPRAWAIEFSSAAAGSSYVGHHFPVLPPGTSELMVFRRAIKIGDAGP